MREGGIEGGRIEGGRERGREGGREREEGREGGREGGGIQCTHISDLKSQTVQPTTPACSVEYTIVKLVNHLEL